VGLRKPLRCCGAPSYRSLLAVGWGLVLRASTQMMNSGLTDVAIFGCGDDDGGYTGGYGAGMNGAR